MRPLIVCALGIVFIILLEAGHNLIAAFLMIAVGMPALSEN